MIALVISLIFCMICVALATLHLPTIRISRMTQLGRAIASAVECRSPFLEGMFDEISDLSDQVGENMGISKQDRQNTKVASLLCDIGLCSVPSTILQKTDEWTPEEQAVFDRHTEIGAQIVKQSAILRKYSTIVQHHHTKFEVEPKTPIASRIISVTADYVRYKRVYGSSRALVVIERQSGMQYDPQVVESLKELVSVR